MAKYRSKAVIIDAIQYDPNDTVGAIAFCDCGKSADFDWYTKDLIIHTLEGDMRAKPGDFIVRGLKGEFYPVRPDIFAMKYERIVTPVPQVPAFPEGE